VENVGLVGHALNAVPATAAHVGDVGGPVVAGGSHDVVHRLLLSLIRSGAVVVHGKPRLRTIYEG